MKHSDQPIAASRMGSRNRRPRPAVLLVEFVIVDRFQCALPFPFIQGWLRKVGGRVLTVRFGLTAATAMAGEDGNKVSLDAGDLHRLLSISRRFKPTHVVFGYEPSEAILVRLLREPPSPVMAWLTPDNGIASSQQSNVSLFDWLGIEPSPTSDPLSFPKPDFLAHSGNAAAGRFRPLPHLPCGTECFYSRPLTRNSYFPDPTLGDGRWAGGCTFCVRPAPLGRADEGPFDRLRLLLEAARTTTRWGNHKPRYRILGEDIFFHLDRFALLVRQMPLRPADFLFNARVEAINRCRSRVEKALRILAGTPHRIQLCLIGIENFSQAELGRFNKGISTESILEMVGILRGFERRFPGHFDFREYGGFSTILYTPWTTLEDVEYNLAWVHHLGLEKLCGKLLGSRLRLYPELPLTRLAARDGLLTGVQADPLFDTARRNFYAQEVPWKFRDVRADAFNRVAVRLEEHPSMNGDPLYQRVQAWIKSAPLPRPQPLASARQVLRRLSKGGPGGTVERLLKQPFVSESHTSPGRTGTDSLALPVSACILMREGLKPAGRMEHIRTDHVPHLTRRLRDFLGTKLHVRFVQGLRTHSSGAECDLFYSFEEGAMDRLIERTRLVQQSFNLEERRQGMREIGILLGYPSCCAQAYAESTPFQWRFNGWIHLRNRVQIADRVSSHMNPYTNGLDHCPCSLACQPTLRLSRSLARHPMTASRNDLRRLRPEHRMKPVLALLDVDGCGAVLEPARPLTEDQATRYAVLQVIGQDPRLKAVASGDTILVGKGRISISLGLKHLQTLVLNAYVWWHQRAFHNRFWRLAIQNEQADVESADILSAKGYGEFHSEVTFILEGARRILASKAGIRVGEVARRGDHGAHVQAIHDRHEHTLHIVPAREGRPPCFSGRHFDVEPTSARNGVPHNAMETCSKITRIMDAFKDRIDRRYPPGRRPWEHPQIAEAWAPS